MKYSLGEYPYASRRVTLQAANGMVSTLQPLAAQAGLEILKKGGNAIDAAIATAVCLTVVMELAVMLLRWYGLEVKCMA